ncbi:unnamed protein product [Gadus morhua 'NCC']
MDQSHVTGPLHPLAKTFQLPCLPDPCPLSQSSSRNPSPSLPPPCVNVSAPTDYSLATPAPHLMSLGPFPCPAQLPQTEYARRLQDRLETAHFFARGQLLSAGRPVGPLSRHRHPSTYSSEPCSSPHRCEWAPDTHTTVFWPWVPT